MGDEVKESWPSDEVETLDHECNLKIQIKYRVDQQCTNNNATQKKDRQK